MVTTSVGGGGDARASSIPSVNAEGESLVLVCVGMIMIGVGSTARSNA